MRDFLPADKARREHALGVIRKSFAAHGFDEIETPVVEDVARLHSGLGGDNEKLAFSVLRRGLDAEDLTAAIEHGDLTSLADLGLRFDLTVPLARFYASHRAELPPVFRAIQIAPVWRAERPQKGRYRQFVQCDIDIIGEAGQLAEVELITATAAALEALGLEGCTIRINDRRILNGLLEFCGFEESRWPQVLISIDKLDKIGAEGVVAELSADGADSAAVLGGVLETLEPHIADGGVELTVEAITSILPDGIDTDAVAQLEALAHAQLAAARREAALRPHTGAGHGLLHRHDLRDLAPRVRQLGGRRRTLRRDDRAVPRNRRARVRVLDRVRAGRRPHRTSRR
jgi:histidyl-tRNA synthetase